MSIRTETGCKSKRDIPARQTLRCRRSILCLVGLLFVSLSGSVSAQLYDALDAHPPRWHLAGSDCDARVITHEHLAAGGVDGRTCESITFTATNGMEAILVYPIEPVRPLDDLTANVSVMSARGGAQIGFRVRYPYVLDPETRRPLSVIVYGAEYDRTGEFATIGVGLIERPLRLKTIAVRREHGTGADLNDPYVDAVVINAYSGVGTTALRIDELHVDGLIPVGDNSGDAGQSIMDRSQHVTSRIPPDLPGDGIAIDSSITAFPVGRITRILQHNGEPLSWVRSLGFDAVLLAAPPNSDILREAIRSRVLIYAPPPSAPDPALKSLLRPVAGWYLGSGEALDSGQIEQTSKTSSRLRSWPAQWRRPIIAAPAEKWRSYAALVDAIIEDLPIRSRGISGGEEVLQMTETRRLLADRVETAVGIASMPPESMLQQVEAIADSIGAPHPEGFRWHSMWLQAMRSLESPPSAILFRSSRSLVSGSELDSERAMALSYVNRVTAMIEPWVAEATSAPAPPCVGAPYRCTRLTTGPTDLLVLTSVATRGSEVLAGDGEVLDVLLSPADASKTAWRLTHFSAETITPQPTETGSRLQIVSPDVAELIVLSSDPSVGGKLSQSATRFARQAGLDRWQLTSDRVRRTREHWIRATSARVVSRAVPNDLIQAAAQTLTEAEPLYRAGEVDASLRMARRADAWALRSEWQLAEALMPNWPHPTSSPPMDCGAAEIQTAWWPLMNDDGWGRNRLNSGSLDGAELLSDQRWKFGRRMSPHAQSEVLLVNRGTYSGAGALRVRVTPTDDDDLPGGYEGTVIQIRSPAVRVAAGTAIRIDAMVRTLGFGRPHQGTLVYDTIGGQEMGVLVRGRADWTPVRVYRQTIEEGEVNVMFEVIGAGEVTIDDVQLRLWEPGSQPASAIRPIADRVPARGESTSR